jgi:hypothetical protein
MTAPDRSLLHTHAHTSVFVHSRVFTSHCLVAAAHGRRSPSSGFPNCPPTQLPAWNINSSQRLKPSSPLTHSLTHQPNDSSLTCPASDISARTAQKTQFLCCWLQPLPITAVVYLLLSRSLPRNGSTCHNMLTDIRWCLNFVWATLHLGNIVGSNFIYIILLLPFISGWPFCSAVKVLKWGFVLVIFWCLKYPTLLNFGSEYFSLISY